jgi:hypothetical protein
LIALVQRRFRCGYCGDAVAYGRFWCRSMEWERCQVARTRPPLACHSKNG